MTEQQVQDINNLSLFLTGSGQSASPSARDQALETADCIVLVGSAILACAETVFSFLQLHSSSKTPPKTLVISGDIGHSTVLLHNAIKSHPKYNVLLSNDSDPDTSAINALQPEARLLFEIGRKFYALDDIPNLRVIVEDKSTNCGANAAETRRVLDDAGIQPRSLAIVQDPTMSLRTVASFQKVYMDVLAIEIVACPPFIPRVVRDRSGLEFDVEQIMRGGLWTMERFLGLLLGEIPRLRDDEEGYGPKGKGFIGHVNITKDIQETWERLDDFSFGESESRAI